MAATGWRRAAAARTAQRRRRRNAWRQAVVLHAVSVRQYKTDYAKSGEVSPAFCNPVAL